MKKPLQVDVIINTIAAAIVSALVVDSIREFLLYTLIFSVFYTLVDGLLGKWE